VDRDWITAVVDALGPRYRLGSPEDGGGVALLHRFGKAEFRATRIAIGGGDGRRVDLVVDFRIPRDAEAQASDPLLEVLVQESLAPRGFERRSEETAAMTTEGGKASGFVRSVRFDRPGGEPAVAAMAIRAIVESIDLPVVIGVHDREHMIAREAHDHPKTLGRPLEPMEKWEYTLAGGLLRSLTAVVDPNVRTLVIVERKLMSSKPLGEAMKLAQIAKLMVRRAGGDAVLSAEKRDGTTVELAKSAYDEELIATAMRLAKKVMIPIERVGES
jgi:hypothetical protein